VIRILSLAAAAALLTAAGASAQDEGPVRTAPRAVAPATTAPAPDEAAVEAAAAAFETRMDDMAKELEAAKATAGSDAAALKTAADAIVAKYQPGADAFAEMVAALIVSRPVAVGDQARARAAVQQVRDMPGLVRDHHLAPVAASARTPAQTPARTPAQTPPATTPPSP
jgi:hypothetical protein